MTLDINHEYWMQKALMLAIKATDIGEIPVGAVIVHNGIIIGKGYNLRESSNNALAHAEVIAIKQACQYLNSWRLENCDIYITLEPCAMCAGAIINSRIKNVFFGASDQKSGCSGSVTNLFEMPFNHKPQYKGGILKQECSTILTDFFKKLREK